MGSSPLCARKRGRTSKTVRRLSLPLVERLTPHRLHRGGLRAGSGGRAYRHSHPRLSGAAGVGRPLLREAPGALYAQRGTAGEGWPGQGRVPRAGELLFTHFGLSGPLVLSASAHMDFRKSQYTAHIDLKPALDEQRLDARLLRDFEERANQDYANALGGLVPRSMVPVLAARTGVPADTKVHDIRREQRRRLLDTLKDFTISLSGPRPVEEAVVTSGGVAVGEVDPRTMESKKARGVFLAGELLDVDGYTGGSTSRLPGLPAMPPGWPRRAGC